MHGADQASALVGLVPAELLPEIRRDECAGDAEQGGEDEACRLVRAGVKKLGDDARDEADDDGPENAHGVLLVGAHNGSRGPRFRTGAAGKD